MYNLEYLYCGVPVASTLVRISLNAAIHLAELTIESRGATIVRILDAATGLTEVESVVRADRT